MRLSSRGARMSVIGLLACLAVSDAAHGAADAALAEEIRRLASAPALSKVAVGVSIVALGLDPTTVYEQHSGRQFKPASNQKLITTAAAMSVLPADFTYRTILALRGDDLVIIGSGDPSVGDPRLARAAGEPITAVFHRWADRLKAAGRTTIRGDLLFDDFVFDQQHVHPSWAEQFDLQKWYAAPVGGLNFNDNCVDVLVKPGEVAGEPAIVRLVPQTPWIRLEDRSRTARKGEPIMRRSRTDPVTISVTGPVSRASDPANPLSIAITDPGAFFSSVCRTVLASRGIKIVGTTRRARVRLPDGTLPASLEIVAVHERELRGILWRVTKSSQNVFAEALLKTLGAYAGRPGSPRVGSYETARVVVRRFLETIGVSPESCVLDDGSGLSHSNRTTPAVLTGILCHMDSHPRRREWWANLAVPGEKAGTLRNRMKDLKGAVFAKTGYIRGVSVLSGYVVGPAQRRYAFSILCNDTDKVKGGTAAARKLQDNICRKLAAWQPPATKMGG